MNIDVQDLRPTIIPRSDQLNADDLLGGPINVTVQAVRAGNKEQPVILEIDGGHQPYKPGKSMRRVLITAWGIDGRAWVGRSMRLYNDPEVIFGGVKVGGIRISHLSHIEHTFTLMLTVTRGKKVPFKVEPMPAQAARTPPANGGRRDVIEQMFEESLKGRLKVALARCAEDRKFNNKGEVRAFLQSLTDEGFKVICDDVLPPKTGGDDEEF